MTNSNGTVLLIRIDGTAQALQNQGPEKYVDMYKKIIMEIEQILSDLGGLHYGAALPVIGWYFLNEESASNALKGAIRVVAFFKQPEFTKLGITCRIAVDSGALIVSESKDAVFGEPIAVAADLLEKSRGNAVFITERAGIAAGRGFCYDEVSRLRLKGYEEKISTKALCGLA